MEIFLRPVIACALQEREENSKMLFVEARIADLSADGAMRILLLEKLQEKGLTPLIRTSRLSCYEQALLGPDRVKEMERAVSNWVETEEDGLYTRGDVFCVEDFVLFLIFGSEEDELTGMRAGIIYGAETAEPQRKLDAFCRNVRDALDSARIGATIGDTAQEEAPQGWKAAGSSVCSPPRP